MTPWRNPYRFPQPAIRMQNSLLEMEFCGEAMRFPRHFPGVFFRILMMIPFLPSANAAWAEDKIYRIVVLYSHRRSIPINDQWDSGLREGVGTLQSRNITWENEYLDFHRVQDPIARTDLLRLLEEKYEEAKPDLVIVVHDGVAGEFAHRDWFPGIPLVFCSVLQETVAPFLGNERVAGVIYRLRAPQTVEAIMKVLPDTQKVIVVSGNAQIDRQFERLIADDLHALPHPDVEYWSGIPREEMYRTASQLQEGTVLLFNSYLRGQSGEIPNVPRDIARELAAASSVPVFALYDTMLGTGVVGGCMESARNQGIGAGRIAARILDGDKPVDIGFVELPAPVLEVDWKQLSRWKIQENSLPVGTTVHYREKSLFEQYRYLILGSVSLIVLQTAMISGLLWSRWRRIKIEAQLQSSRNEAVELAGKVLTAQEDERRRIAREMHDGIAQRLVALSLETQWMERSLQNAPNSALNLTSICNEIRSISDDVRDLSRDIHPAVLEDLGLVQALEVEVKRLKEHSKLDIQFFRPLNLPRLSPNVELCVYRIAQEALRNAIQHSGSSRVNLRLATDAEGVELRIEDFGCGFDASQRHSQNGIGLHTMQERARLAGGILEIASRSEPSRAESYADHGTVVSFRIPMGDER